MAQSQGRVLRLSRPPIGRDPPGGGSNSLRTRPALSSVFVDDGRFRIHHPCPYCHISVRFPRTLLLLWCDNRRDVFLVSSPEAGELRDVLATLRKSFRGKVLLQDAESALVEV